jgi:hypothetical protein
MESSPESRARAAQPRLGSIQLFRLKGLLVCYMKARYFAGLCPYDTNTVGIGDSFSESLPAFQNSVAEWPEDEGAQKIMFDKTVRALEA